MPRAVALFSGGLDSMLAVRLMQEQGFEVDALNVRTPLRCCRASAAAAAAELGVPLAVLAAGDDYLDVIRRPAHGYGKAVNPCVDCRIYMARLARQWSAEIGACVVVSGEVLGQREMSQKRLALDRIARESGLEGRLLRPLSARLLAPTIPEREGLVDRAKLGAMSGRGRRELIALARRLGIRTIPTPSAGCPLVEVSFAPRVRDLIAHRPAATRWEFELLALGRHVRVDAQTKLVVGRNAEENALLERFLQRADVGQAALLSPEGFSGPEVLVVGPATRPALDLAGALMLRYGKGGGVALARLREARSEKADIVEIRARQEANRASPL
jgi:hypothetical protein